LIAADLLTQKDKLPPVKTLQNEQFQGSVALRYVTTPSTDPIPSF